MPDPPVSVSEAARFLDVPEEEARKLADAEGNVPLETLRSRAGAATIARELAGAHDWLENLSALLPPFDAARHVPAMSYAISSQSA